VAMAERAGHDDVRADEQQAGGGPTLEDRFFIDAMSPAAREDPYPHYEAYRSAEPLVRAAETIWFCLAHTEVSALLRNPLLSTNETRASTEAGVDEQSIVRTQSLLFMDPPDHTRLRGLVSRAFTPRRVEGLRSAVEAICAGLLDELTARIAPGAVFDLVGWLAYPLPVQVICSLWECRPPIRQSSPRGPARWPAR
jgi:cytochrome P450